MRKSSSGFTLIELLITLAIIGIIAAIAVPSYQSYVNRAKYSELVQAAAPYKLGVIDCFNSTGALANCDTDTNGVPASRTVGYVGSVAVADGVITITGSGIDNAAGASATYVLTPTDVSGTLTWVETKDTL